MTLALPRRFKTAPNSERDVFIDAAHLPSTAVLLDVDGTLLDIAPTPLEVVVPPDLVVMLERLHKRTGGALAFVSGRPLAELDLFFQPLRIHGDRGAWRGAAHERRLDPPRLHVSSIRSSRPTSPASPTTSPA